MTAKTKTANAGRKSKKKTAAGILLTAALLAALACTSNSSTVDAESAASAGQGGSTSSGNALPVGFQSYSAPNGSGRLIFAKLPPGSHSARAVMRDSLGSLRNYFDAPPQLQGAVSDPQDQVVQVILGASLHGQPVRGVATAVVGQSGATFGLVLDHPDALKSSFQTLSQRLSQEMPKGSGGSFDLSAPKQWQRQTAGDRSAAVDLPPGWRVTMVNQGIVTVVGPHDELIQLGLIFFVSTLPGSQGMTGHYLQPVPAFSYFVNYFTQVNLRQGLNLNNVPGRVLEVKEVPSALPGGRGAYLVQEITTNGKPAKILALVYTAQNLLSGWTLYTSYVAAPADLFPGELGDMMRIWASWKVKDEVYQRQMQQTLQSMSETRDILASGTEHQMHAYDNLEENMGLIIRGETRLQNNTLGGRADVYTQNSDAVLQGCKNRGYECQVVPFNELSQP